MDPQTQTGGGQFGIGLGGTDALKQAMQRRGIDASILDQVSPASGGASAVPTAVPETNPNIGGVDQAVASQAVGGQASANPKASFRSAEMEISLKALQNTVATENKIAQSSLGMI